MEPKQPLLTFQILEGKAEVSSSGGSSWSQATDGMILLVGDHVRTLAVSEAVVYFGDGSKVKLEPSTELEMETFALLGGGPPDGQRVVRVRLIDGGISFDVTDAPTPPNIWEFLTRDGIIAIHGTLGSLSSRDSEENLELNILEGEASLAHVRIDEQTGEPELDLLTVADGSLVTLPSGEEGLDNEVRDALLGVGEIIALGGQDAIDAVISSGGLEAGLAIGRSAFAGDDEARGVVEIFANISDFVDFERDEANQTVLIPEDELEDIEFDLRSGTVDNGFIELHPCR